MARKSDSLLERLNIESLYNTFVGLPPKQQIVALGGGILLALMLIVLPISLASSHLASLEDRIEKSRGEITDIVRQIGDYDRLKGEYGSITDILKRGAGSSISSSIESLAQNAQMKENVDSIKERPMVPSDLFDELTVDVAISKISLEQLVVFLHQIENDPNQFLRVKKIQIKARHDNRTLLDASFSVSSYRLTGES